MPLKIHFNFIACCTLISQMAASMLSRVTWASLRLLVFVTSFASATSVKYFLRRLRVTCVNNLYARITCCVETGLNTCTVCGVGGGGRMDIVVRRCLCRRYRHNISTIDELWSALYRRLSRCTMFDVVHWPFTGYHSAAAWQEIGQHN